MEPKKLLAIDVSHHHVQSALVTLGLAGLPRVSAKERLALGQTSEVTALQDLVCGIVDERLGAGEPAFDAVGIAFADPVDPLQATVIDRATALPLDLKAALQETYGLAAHLLPRHHALALGEALWGAGRLWESALVVHVGHTLDGAFVDRGTISLGAHGAAGSIGHVLCPEAEGEVCPCGAHGHAYPVAISSGILKEYLRISARDSADDGVIVDIDLVYELAQSQDDGAIAALERSGGAVGSALGSLCNVYDPAGIILTGSVTKAGPAWDEALERAFSASVMEARGALPRVRGELDDLAPLLGAAEHAQREVYRP